MSSISIQTYSPSIVIDTPSHAGGDYQQWMPIPEQYTEQQVMSNRECVMCGTIEAAYYRRDESGHNICQNCAITKRPNQGVNRNQNRNPKIKTPSVSLI